MGVLATIFGTTYVALSGPSKAPAATPPINASSSDEAEFIKYDPSRDTLMELGHGANSHQEILGASGSGR